MKATENVLRGAVGMLMLAVFVWLAARIGKAEGLRDGFRRRIGKVEYAK